MAFSIDNILMAYRPLYLRGLLMDGQYRLPAAPDPPPVTGKTVNASTEISAKRTTSPVIKPLQGAAT